MNKETIVHRVSAVLYKAPPGRVLITPSRRYFRSIMPLMAATHACLGRSSTSAGSSTSQTRSCAGHYHQFPISSDKDDSSLQATLFDKKINQYQNWCCGNQHMAQKRRVVSRRHSWTCWGNTLDARTQKRSEGIWRIESSAVVLFPDVLAKTSIGKVR